MNSQLPITSSPAFIEFRLRWEDDWQQSMWMDVVEVTRALPPTMSQATFCWKYGKIRRPGERVFRNVVFPTDPLKCWVRITDVDTNKIDFVGRVTSSRRRPGGQDPALTGTGDMEFQAMGLEYLLSRYCDIDGSFIKDGDDIGKVDTLIPFNGRSSRGLSLTGNRSSAKHEFPNGRSCYIFSDEGEVWTAYDVIEYLIVAWTPSSPAFQIPALSPADSETKTVVDNLASLTDTWPQCRQVGEMITSIIRRQRAHSWDVNGTGTNPLIQFHSVFDSQVTAAGLALQPNENQVFLDLDSGMLTPVDSNGDIAADADDPDDDISEGLAGIEITKSLDNRYDEIVVEGEPILACGTVSVASGTLAKGWTDAEQTAYNNATAEARRNDTHAKVYTTFHLPATDPNDLFISAPGFKQGPPAIDSNGNVDFTLTPYTFFQGKTLARQLPLVNESATFNSASPQEFWKPLVWIKTPEGDYWPVDKLKEYDEDYPNLSVWMLDDRLGFRVNPNPQHFLGEGHFTGDAEKDAVLNYNDLVATVALPLDAHLRVRVPIHETVDFPRRLTIKIPGAHLWVLVPWTVYRLSDGELAGHTDGTDGRVLRNDRDRLAAVAAMAKAWYEKPRRAIKLEYRKIVPRFIPGMMIQHIKTSNHTQAVMTLVSSVTWNFAEGRTTIQTDFAELDASGILGSNSPTALPSFNMPGNSAGIPAAGTSAPAGEPNLPAREAGEAGKIGDFPAIITEVGTGEYEGKYSWCEATLSEAGLWQAKPGGRSGSYVIKPAQEFAGSTGPSAVSMQVYHDTIGQLHYRFSPLPYGNTNYEGVYWDQIDKKWKTGWVRSHW